MRKYMILNTVNSFMEKIKELFVAKVPNKNGYIPVWNNDGSQSATDIKSSDVVKQADITDLVKQSDIIDLVKQSDINTIANTLTYNNVELANLQSLINSLPKLMIRDVTINVLPGTITSAIIIRDFYGPRRLQILGSDVADGDTTRTVDRFEIHGISALDNLTIRGFNVTITNGGGFSINRCSTYVFINRCRATGGVNTNTNNVGIWVNECTGYTYVSNCTISNKYYAFRSGMGDEIVAINTVGSNNNIIYRTENGGRITIRNEGLITGAIHSSENNGGVVIRPSGLVNKYVLLPEGTSVNDVKGSGFYRFRTGSVPGEPFYLGDGHLIVSGASNWNLQIASTYSSNLFGIRVGHGSVWEPWHLINTVPADGSKYSYAGEWTNLPLQNGATNYSGAELQYRKVNGVVFLSGLVIANSQAELIIANLPAWFRPGRGKRFITFGPNSLYIRGLYINPNGNVQFYSTTDVPANSFLAIEASFVAEQ